MTPPTNEELVERVRYAGLSIEEAAALATLSERLEAAERAFITEHKVARSLGDQLKAAEAERDRLLEQARQDYRRINRLREALREIARLDIAYTQREQDEIARAALADQKEPQNAIEALESEAGRC